MAAVAAVILMPAVAVSSGPVNVLLRAAIQIVPSPDQSLARYHVLDPVRNHVLDPVRNLAVVHAAVVVLVQSQAVVHVHPADPGHVQNQAQDLVVVQDLDLAQTKFRLLNKTFSHLFYKYKYIHTYIYIYKYKEAKLCINSI